jgi:hypothetical protein
MIRRSPLCCAVHRNECVPAIVPTWSINGMAAFSGVKALCMFGFPFHKTTRPYIGGHRFGCAARMIGATSIPSSSSASSGLS